MRYFKSLKKLEKFTTSLEVSPDKSISHRLVIASLFTSGKSVIKNFLKSEDTNNTLDVVTSLGVNYRFIDSDLILEFDGILISPNIDLYCGNSGTTIRLILGFLSSCVGIKSTLYGDKYLNSRPMKRVIDPLNSFGGNINSSSGTAPLHVIGKKLSPFRYEGSISSAQVKSSLILASLNSGFISYYKEPMLSRDHSENIFNYLGASIDTNSDGFLVINPLLERLKGFNLSVPADPSSAFYIAILVAITPKSNVLLKNVTLNKTRIEAYKVLIKMGVKVEFIKRDKSSFEDIGDIYVEHKFLRSVDIKENISWLIDELPALAIAMACADGISSVSRAVELRYKESNRINSVVSNLNKCGVLAIEREDGYSISGSVKNFNRCCTIDSYGDHRVALSFIIASIRFANIKVNDVDCIMTSFPDFFDIISMIGVFYEYRNSR